MSKRRFRRKRKFIKGSALKLARTALKRVKRVEKKVAGAELKFTNSGFVTQVVDNVGHVHRLSLITQGVGQAQRIGQKVTIKSIEFWGSASIGLAPSGFTTLRIMLIQDKRQVADGIPAPGTIFQDLSPFSPLDMVTGLNRFRVFYNRFIYLNVIDKTSTTFRLFKRINIPMLFNGVSSADVEKNGLFMVMISDEPVVANRPTFNYYYRSRYYDM